MADKPETPDVSPVSKALDELAPEPEDKSASFWAAPAARLRATTRWTLAVFGVIGTAFLAAVPFAGLGDLTWPSLRAGFATGGVIAVVAGLTLTLRAGAEVFISRIGTLSDLRVTLDEIQAACGGDFTDASLVIFQGMAIDADDLAHEWQRARRERWRTALASAGADETSNLPALGDIAKQRFDEIDDASTRAVGFATYRELVAVYRWAQRWIMVGSCFVAVGVFAFFTSVQSSDAASAGADASASSASTVFFVGAAESECSVEVVDPSTVKVLAPTDTTCVVTQAAPATAPVEEADDEEPGVWEWTWPYLPAAGVLLVAIALLLRQRHRLNGDLRDGLIDGPA